MDVSCETLIWQEKWITFEAQVPCEVSDLVQNWQKSSDDLKDSHVLYP